ncbi:glycoside hydrolase family 127 protein [Paenibacillus sp. JX-17]|uniref:Glycoside hydrolase family 127 protein n=1 Tax=Paenibacillus lacisoli TaxID=3064525 RepID=A0ABT9CFS3_9BACL|nr:beta-L-arabinofuranosidase domain-containing protein [Paenibacillus sp. JX-17]MDO7908056.1 glycoside hydrolase family 127 protein [Paenibacillus sp. JX-17]
MMANMSHTAAGSVQKVDIKDTFWSKYLELVRDVVVPYQWEALNDRVEQAEPSRAIRNFRIAAGEAEGEFYGMVFQDSDVAKWLEAAAYLCSTERDPELEKIADGVIDLIARAQQPDGYVNTYYTVKEPGGRYTDLAECHELYCAGHLIEAGAAYYQATGKRKILDVVTRLADHLHDVFGPNPGQIRGYDGHQEIELALMKLYEVTGDMKYVDLCNFFVQERGRQPHFYEQEAAKRNYTSHWGGIFKTDNYAYSQAHAPVTEQHDAVGHAVRFVYMCTGMAHLAAVTGDQELKAACRRLWDNMVNKRMYITGAIGSQASGEAFTVDYDLPGDTAYAETCASCGIIFWARRMLMLEPDSQYADVMERALYNTVLGGMSRDGRSFFYVNPLEVDPGVIAGNHTYQHVKPVRQEWFGCACCPPNIARLLASLGQYVYSIYNHTIYTHLYVGGEACFELGHGNVVLRQESNYPWNGEVTLTVDEAVSEPFGIALRIPDWCPCATIKVNGEAQPLDGIIEQGYAVLNREWKQGDRIELQLTMPVTVMKGHPHIRDTAGRVALQRGPLVYCLEEADNGPRLHELRLLQIPSFGLHQENSLMEGMTVISAAGQRLMETGWSSKLYRPAAAEEWKETELRFIPYFSWANRGVGEMRVWFNSVEPC